MRIEIKTILNLFVFLFCLLPVWVWAGSYTVTRGTTTVDGNTFCGGSACTSSDTITIEGGARGTLVIQNFNGNGSYITIQNHASTRVVMTGNGVGDGNGVLAINNCRYIDVRGDNLEGTTYGIKVINNHSRAGSVWVKGQSDHIKLSYLEVTCEGSTTETGNGIFVQDGTEASTWTWDTIEIHHNYIHDARYSGMYLGQNDPNANDNPYIANVSVHDNTIDDSGGYGLTLKGIKSTSGVCSIYNNSVDTTGLVTTSDDTSGHHGIGVQQFGGTAYANVYNNTIIKTKGPGLKIGASNHNIYNNLVLGCGTGNNESYGHGIVVFYGADGIDLYDNIIIQPTRYGIYSLFVKTAGVTLARNKIGGAGLGEWNATDSGDIVELSGDNANIYYTDVADFKFPVWSDDGDYGNDTFSTTKEFPWPGKDKALEIIINN